MHLIIKWHFKHFTDFIIFSYLLMLLEKYIFIFELAIIIYKQLLTIVRIYSINKKIHIKAFYFIKYNQIHKASLDTGFSYMIMKTEMMFCRLF